MSRPPAPTRSGSSGSSKDFRFQYYKNLGIDAVERPLENMLLPPPHASPIANRSLFLRQLRDLCNQTMPTKLRCRLWKILTDYHDVYHDNWPLVDVWREDMFSDLVDTVRCMTTTTTTAATPSAGSNPAISDQQDTSSLLTQEQLLVEHCLDLFEKLHDLQLNIDSIDNAWHTDQQLMSVLSPEHHTPVIGRSTESGSGSSGDNVSDSMASVFQHFDARHGISALVDPFLQPKAQKPQRRSPAFGSGAESDSPTGTGGMLLRQLRQRRREMTQKLSIARVFITVFLEDEQKQGITREPTPQSLISQLQRDDTAAGTSSNSSANRSIHEHDDGNLDTFPLPTSSSIESSSNQVDSQALLFRRYFKSISASYWCWHKCLKMFVQPRTPSKQHNGLSIDTTQRASSPTEKWHATVHYMINEMNRLCMEQFPDVYNVLYACRLRSSGDSIEQQRQMLDEIFEKLRSGCIFVYLCLLSLYARC